MFWQGFWRTPMTDRAFSIQPAKLVALVFRFGPFLFGVGFLAPLFAEVASALGHAAVGGIPAIWAGLLVGTVWGGIATRTGRWT